MIDKFLGMRKGVAQDHNLYAVSWMENVKFCLENGIGTLQSGQTAYTLKLRLGSRLEASGIWFRHKGAIMNTLLTAGARWVAFDTLDPDLKAWRKRLADDTKTRAKPR